MAEYARVREVAIRIRRVGRQSYRSPRIRRALEAAASAALDTARARVPVRDGYLRASLYSEVDGPDVVIGSTELYAEVHEEGGVIRPVRARWLTIPLLGQRGWARHDPTPMWVHRARSGRLYLVERISSTRIRPRWWLRDMTVVPPRRFLRAGMDVVLRRLRSAIPQIIDGDLLGGR